MVKAIYHESLMPVQGRSAMLGREVWGWRVLAAMLVLLLVPTIAQLDTLENGWRESISPPAEDGEPQVGDDSNYSSNDEEIIADEPEADEDGDTAGSQESDDAPYSEKSLVDSEDSMEEGLEGNTSPDWILPATQVIVLSMMAIMAVGLLTSTAAAILTSEAARFSILLALAGPLLAVTQRGEGGIFTRGRILGFVEAHPGIHFSALRDALSLGNGVTAHHINILEKEGRIVTWKDGKVRRFASSGIDQKRLKEIKSPVIGMQIAILQVLADSGELGIKSGELRSILATSRQLLSYHMKQLSERKYVTSVGKGRATKWSLLEEGQSQLENSTHLTDI